MQRQRGWLVYCEQGGGSENTETDASKGRVRERLDFVGIVAFSWVMSLYTSIRQWRRRFLHLNSKLTGCFWKIKEQGKQVLCSNQICPSLWSQGVFSLPQETGSAGLSETAQVMDHLHLKFSILVMCRINWEWILPFQELVRMLDFFPPSFGKSVRFLLMGGIMIWALPRSPASSPSSRCKPDLLQEPALIAEIRLLWKKPSPAPWGLLCEVCRNEEQKEDPLVQSDSEKERKHDLSSPNYGSEHRDPRPGAWSLPPRLFSSLMWNNPLSVIAGLWVS